MFYSKVNHIRLFISALLIFISAPLSFSQVEFLKGADISSLQQIEDNAGVFKENDVQKDPIQLLKSHGINIIRIRLWNNPLNGYNNISKLLEIAKRIKQNNLKLWVDFHFSDLWADPGQQYKPAAWASLSLGSLEDSIYQFTKSLLVLLKNQNTFPDIIQLGNEITNGFLWNDGRIGGVFDTPVQWNQFTSLLKKCILAANEIKGNDSLKIMIHIDKSGDSTACRWFFDNLDLYNVQYDYIGLSYYPWWHGDLGLLSSNLDYLARRYHKPIIIAETAYPWTLDWNDTTQNIIGLQSQLLPAYPATIDGQKSYLSALLDIVSNTPLNLGKGVIYWEPLCISTKTFGSSWENLALFDFNNNMLNSISAFENINSVISSNNSTNDFSLQQNFPNPFNPDTKIRFTLHSRTSVSLRIFDLLGKEIVALFDGETIPDKTYEINFNARSLPSGVYIYRLFRGSNILTKKMMLMK